MRFFFTDESRRTDRRAADIRAALVHARHEVIHGHSGQAAPAGTDVWMHGLGLEGGPPLPQSTVDRLLASKAEVVLLQLCDAESMSFDVVPEELARRVRLFLRNHWPSDVQLIPEAYRDRIGWLPPMLKPMKPHPGKPLSARVARSVFFGTRTGFTNMSGGMNAREQTVRIMRDSRLPFEGGLVLNKLDKYQTAPELIVPRISGRSHARFLQNSCICLAPWGNHPLTYRHFEGLAFRCLVLAQSIRKCRFLDGGLVPGEHFVEINDDLSNLAEQVDYFLNHLDEAQRIADAGHAHFERFFASRGRLVSSWIYEATVASWGSLYQASDATGPLPWLRSVCASWFPNQF
jgi:hypothetical protein